MDDESEAYLIKAKRQKPHPVTKFRCHKCEEPGHFAKDCTTDQGRESADGYVAQSVRRGSPF